MTDALEAAKRILAHEKDRRIRKYGGDAESVAHAYIEAAAEVERLKTQFRTSYMVDLRDEIPPSATHVILDIASVERFAASWKRAEAMAADFRMALYDIENEPTHDCCTMEKMAKAALDRYPESP